jgi:23S rRNA (adenine2030-N6)-methyltransferase
MNYRHAYHAGNHADVLKHVVFARIIEHLKKKDKPFGILDAHGGIGAYDLTGVEAGKTGEWETGVGKMVARFSDEIEALLAPYRQVLTELNPDGGSRYYPGSPEIAVRLMRLSDRLTANEMHPVDAEILKSNYGGDGRVHVTALDANIASRAMLPLDEKRGVVLLDPPYEVLDETQGMMTALADGHKRFGTGIFVLWYPVKGTDFSDRLLMAAKALGLPEMLQVELRVKESFQGGGLAGSGLIIVNPPWKLEEELQLLLPALAARLGVGEWGRSHIEWLTPPR